MNETITWIPAAERLPDEGIVVLVARSGSDEPVWLAYCEAGQWREVDSWPIDKEDVLHWAEVPRGPVCRACDGTHTVEVPCPIQPGRFVRVPCEACGS